VMCRLAMPVGLLSLACQVVRFSATDVTRSGDLGSSERCSSSITLGDLGRFEAP
jgi:hypothetical protein